MILSPVSELEAVNQIISSVGESPVNTLENPANVDVINAIRILSMNNRLFQSKGWSFNFLPKYILNPDIHTKRIPWSNVYLFLRGHDRTRYVKRDGYIFNFTEQTFIFPKAIHVQCILLVPFEEMPEAARQYITVMSAQEFQLEYLGDPNLTKAFLRREAAAWAALQEYEMDLNRYSSFDNKNVQWLLRR